MPTTTDISFFLLWVFIAAKPINHVFSQDEYNRDKTPPSLIDSGRGKKRWWCCLYKSAIIKTSESSSYNLCNSTFTPPRSPTYPLLPTTINDIPPTTIKEKNKTEQNTLPPSSPSSPFSTTLKTPSHSHHQRHLNRSLPRKESWLLHHHLPSSSS